MDHPPSHDTATDAAPIPLRDILLSFLRLGATSFGGGTTAWTHRETVERRGWISEQAFLQALTVGQVLPGANPVNLAVFLGMQMRGAAGATVAAVGMILPAFVLILVLAGIYQSVKGYPEAQAVLTGLACVGIAATLTSGVKTGRQLRGKLVPILIAAVVFVLVGVLRWPLVWVVLALTPASFAAAYIRGRSPANG